MPNHFAFFWMRRYVQVRALTVLALCCGLLLSAWIVNPLNGQAAPHASRVNAELHPEDIQNSLVAGVQSDHDMGVSVVADFLDLNDDVTVLSTVLFHGLVGVRGVRTSLPTLVAASWQYPLGRIPIA
jgi:hypothetical protein